MITTHALINLDGSVIGILLKELSVEAVVDIRQSGLVELDHHKVMIEPINIEGVVYIFGAGHVSTRHLDYAKTVAGQLRKRS